MAALAAMLSSLRNRAELLVEKAQEASAPLVEKLEPYTVLAQDYYAMAQPYLTTAFQYGLIPFILVLGMSGGSPRPKLTDLMNPI